MPEVSNLGLFAVAALLLAVTPGPAVLYIVTRSASQGRAAGVVSCLGVSLGGLVHVLATALGLSAVLATSALAINLVKYAGAGYLMWLGLRKLTQRHEPGPTGSPEPRSLLRVFHEAVWVNVLNPKTALFFLGFLPLFVTPRGEIVLQCVFLGGLFVLIALCTDTAWSLIASGAGTWLRLHPGFVSSQRYVVGSVYLGLGLASALSGDGRQ